MKKILFKLKHKFLIIYKIFGIKSFKRHSYKLYSKYGVIFNGFPGYIGLSVKLIYLVVEKIILVKVPQLQPIAQF